MPIADRARPPMPRRHLRPLRDRRYAAVHRRAGGALVPEGPTPRRVPCSDRPCRESSGKRSLLSQTRAGAPRQRLSLGGCPRSRPWRDLLQGWRARSAAGGTAAAPEHVTRPKPPALGVQRPRGDAARRARPGASDRLEARDRRGPERAPSTSRTPHTRRPRVGCSAARRCWSTRETRSIVAYRSTSSLHTPISSPTGRDQSQPRRASRSRAAAAASWSCGRS
jgi:hypothetical protein